MQITISHPIDSVESELSLPGDKSISHRILMFSALANGSSDILNLNTGLDVQATQQALQNLDVSHPIVDCQNSGTSARLLCGLLAKHAFDITLTGDASLSKRPMQRVASILAPFGAKIHTSNAGGFPVCILKNDRLQAANVTLPVASAQMKSACILAAIQAEGDSVIAEPLPSRDHTERLLKLYGANIKKLGNVIYVAKSELKPIQFTVPGDPSSAAFLIVATLIAKKGNLYIRNISLNPSRIGFIRVLQEMGARITIKCEDPDATEPVGSLQVKASRLTSVSIFKDLVPNIIDEIPILMIAASCAEGATYFEGIQELRFKESDRILSMTENLKKLGIHSESTQDSVTVHGGKLKGAHVESFGDHRIAMSFLVAAAACEQSIQVSDTHCIQTSFPEFFELAHTMGLSLASLPNK